MKRIRTTADQYQIGKKCNCFYKGEIHACEVTGLSSNHAFTSCRLDGTNLIVNVRTSCVNWTDNPEVEETWKEVYEARQDRRERLAETHKAMQQTVMDKIRLNRQQTPHEKVSKRKQEINPEALKALTRRMKMLCGAGSHAVSQLLNVLERNGETAARLFHLALDIEKQNLLCYRYNQYETRHFYWTIRKSLLFELLEYCKIGNIPYGHPERNKGVICVQLPGCETLSFPVKQWMIQAMDIPSFNLPWDGKTHMNLRKIENAVMEKYGWYLRMKYPERFTT